MMKRIFVLWTLLTVLTLAAVGDEQEKYGVVLPGRGHVNTEQLNRKIDLTLDVSQLNLTEVRVLRNAFWARQGYPFKDAFLRGVFETTSWYDSLMYVFDENPANFQDLECGDEEDWRDFYYRTIKPAAIKLTSQEQAFVERLKAREKELLKLNFTTTGDDIVNTANICNAMQLKDIDERLITRLGQKGFAIIPTQHNQLFHVYESNDYANFPNFVTTDLFIQIYHLYFDTMLRDVENHQLDSLLALLCQSAREAVDNRLKQEKGKELRDAAEWLNAYFTVAICLHDSVEQIPAGTGTYATQAQDELHKVLSAENRLSPFLGYVDVNFTYSIFRPRGHYTRSPKLQRYFRTMMWLQTVPFGTDRREQLTRALLLADIIGNDATLTKLYRQITEPLTFLMGNPDNVDIMQTFEALRQAAVPLPKLLKNKKALTTVREQIEQTAEQQTRIRPKYLRTSKYKINLMPQRYQPDAEVLQEMVDYDSNPTRRATPAGLDVFAAMGMSEAERILLQERHEDTRWNGFKLNLERMKQLMGKTNWNETLAKQWMKTLQAAADKDTQHAPYFMLSSQWDKKALNAMLAGWAELKHDAILYAKQPMGAECGGGGPPEPVTKAYVEPNVSFWQKAIVLLDNTADMLRRYGLMTEKVEVATTDIHEQLEMLLNLSKKELEGKRLSDQEYDQLAKIGSAFEYISIDLVREPDQYLMGWSDVQGPDRSVALVADVYTANADNNEDHKCVLYEAVGQADEIYVIVEMEGMLYLTRGAVLSYREFDRPLDQQRLTDEEWQEYLKGHPRSGVPQWMEEIIVPLETEPEPDEEYFYGSGC